jgi:hypothetical protein
MTFSAIFAYTAGLLPGKHRLYPSGKRALFQTDDILAFHYSFLPKKGV